ncbi:hypothetical protein [Actinoplanes friuliensis]|uniref:HEAT repeat domain-containing protein n=1 Tax=Actinoplanes friuliensis DSM 7358 TaxID=1246995 RepID=U5VYB2_9ACTN|nr:hypothetical protein [Actinoplanes friuliensis]AGZ41767.1 hypothetical protein AFR_17445 [Actinoplanes friuliensis DSM 7358]
MTADLWGTDRQRQNEAYAASMAETVPGVPWDELVAHLADKDNHNRAIAAQLLCNHAAQDPTGRIIGADLDALVAVTWDERFVTARHCLQSLWKVGLGSDAARAAVVTALARRYRDSTSEKNGTLVRNDIVESLRKLHASMADPVIESTARELIDEEPDLKYRRKYARHWK